MSTTGLTKDARGLASEVVAYLKADARMKSVTPRVASLFTKVTAQAVGHKTARVETGVPLGDAQKKALIQVLSKKTGHAIEVENVVTPEVIGGLRIRLGDWVIDTTLSGELASLARSLTT